MTDAGTSNGRAPRQDGGELELFASHCVIVMRQRSTAASSHDHPAFPSQMQCTKHLFQRTPATFTFTLSMDAECLGVHLTVQNALLQKLPYIAELQKQKLGDQAGQKKASKGTDASHKVSFNPGCSMWGLVSLLLLVENEVQLERWFGDEDSDASLATHTLLMAEQLGCKDQMAAISDWLLNAAKAVSEHNEESLGESSAVLRSSVDSSEGPGAKRQCKRLTIAQYWHYARVLKTLTSGPCKQVVVNLTASRKSRSASAEVAVLLPITLQRTWLASFWPVLDMQSAKLTSMQWTHILASVVHVESLVGTRADGPRQPLEALHVPMPTDVKRMVKNTLLGKMQFTKCPTHMLDKHLAQCSKCQATRDTNGPIQIIGKCDHPLASISNVSLSNACPCQALEKAQIKIARGMLHGILVGLEGATCMLRLKTLALHDFVIPPVHIPILGSIFQNLSETLTDLFFQHAGSNSDVQTWVYHPRNKTALFRAIAMLENLENLTMFYWEEFVGPDIECAEPLQKLRNLKVVHVEKVTDARAFSCGLNFAPIQVAQEQ